MDRGAFWVFAYGSLIWRPDFAFSERVVARLDGFRRSFCLASIHYRGTPQAPGLVLALDHAPGSACAGLAYRVSGPEAGRVLEEIRARELVSYAYREMWLPLELADGRRVEAVTYVTDPAHAQYRGGLSLNDQAAIIARAEGSAGPNRAYLHNTAASLAALGIDDPDVSALVRLVGE